MSEVSDVQPMPVMEFEGSFIREMVGKLPAISLDMPEGYRRGIHLKMDLELRIRNVGFRENKDGDLVREHVFAIEEAKLYDAFDPDDRPDNVGGNSAGDAWVDILADFLNGDTDELDFEGEEIPDRLRELLEAHYQQQAMVSIAAPGVEIVTHPNPAPMVIPGSTVEVDF